MSNTISITEEEYSRMVRDNQAMLQILERVNGVCFAAGISQEKFILQHQGLFFALNATLDKIKNPVEQIPDRKTGMTPYEEMFYKAMHQKTEICGIPVVISPDMPDDVVWVGYPTYDKLATKEARDAVIEVKAKKKKKSSS